MAPSKIDEKKKLLRHHRAVFLNLIRKRGPLSRTYIYKTTNIRITTVTDVVKELIESGIVIEVGSAASTGGRKPVLLSINPAAGSIIGVDVRATVIRGVLTDLKSQIISQYHKDITALTTGEAILENTKEVIRSLVQLVPDRQKLLGIGLSVAAMVDSDKGEVVFAANIPGWDHLALTAIIEKEFHTSVLLEATARAAVLGERAFGCGQGIDDLIFYHIGMGIGAGIISHGRLFCGTNESAGEIGHTVIDEFGPACRCGNFGCLEALASAKAIRDHAVAALGKGIESILTNLVDNDHSKITAETVYHAAVKGDKLCRRILQEAGAHLGIGAANLINILNPALLIVGGGLSKAGEFILEPLIRTLQERSLAVSAKAVKVVTSTLGDNAAPLGATTLVLKRVFAIPELPAPPEIEPI
ncbi:MAG: ROK family protein [bacterium]|nr:ROK family protein [bacterium]